MRRSLALCLLMLAAVANSAFAIGEARITGKIVDGTTKQPIPNVKINVKALEGKTFNQDFPAKPTGEYAIFLLDGTLKYRFTYTAEGYAPYTEDMKLKLGEPNSKNVELNKGGATPAGGAKLETKATADPAVVAYNEGAGLANAGDDAGAIKKFQEAVAAKPDMIAGWEALSKIQLRAKDFKGAVESAQKALAIDSSEAEMNGVMYEAYVGLGDKAKAAEWKKKLPANAGSLYNDAVKLMNTGKLSEAEPLLKQAIAADDKFALAYLQLGIIYAGSGKNADAKTNLEKYLELDPKGSEAATAKEMLAYVK
ncbi:MAG TPA: tetratricopeptide repeat protein [Thermoanaerobaculia bacterium]|nr:tetratricopeptide repeat protein [Thermoanaerobaculia bacterium]